MVAFLLAKHKNTDWSMGKTRRHHASELCTDVLQ